MTAYPSPAPAPAPERRFKVIDLVKVPSMEPTRVGKFDLMISYQDATGRVRMITIPYEDWEKQTDMGKEELIKKAIMQEESERLKYIGKEFTV
jgi:hypothetical protein